jgi:CRISPR-associated protein Cas1
MDFSYDISANSYRGARRDAYDRMLARLFNTKTIRDADFIKDSNGVLLKEESRRRVIQDWDEQIRTTIYYRYLKRNCSYRQIIRRDCYQLIRYFLEDEPLKFFRLE